MAKMELAVSGLEEGFLSSDVAAALSGDMIGSICSILCLLDRTVRIIFLTISLLAEVLGEVSVTLANRSCWAD